MTHLVEMQRALPKFKGAGVKLYAVSYDDQAALADFARHHGIEFTLFSDADSRVIREYGILNTLVPKHETPFYGIPFPGTYITDESGIVVAKYFPRQIAMRESAETFIDAALGEILLSEDEPQVRGGAHDIPIQVVFHGGGSLKNGLQRKIIIRFDLPPGLHIYAEPVPEGIVATTVEVDGPDGLNVGPTVFPPTQTLRLEGTDIELAVWSGRVDLEVPIWAGDELAPLLISKNGKTHADIEIRVRYQACDNSSCGIPQTETFELTIPIEAGNTPRLPIFRDSKTSTTMPTAKHFLRMLGRSLKQRPWLAPQMLGYLLRQRRALRKGPTGGKHKPKAG